MIAVFAEYKIKDEERAGYLAWITPLREQEGFELYEGTDQPSLFVEIWTVADEEAYAALKKKRLDLSELDRFVVGGMAKVHMWAFRKI